MTKLWIKDGNLVAASGKLEACADCPCAPTTDSCCGTLPFALCMHLASSDGCQTCMDKQVVNLSNSGFGGLVGSVVTSCGTVQILLGCGVCCPTVLLPSSIHVDFYLDTLETGGVVSSATLTWNPVTGYWEATATVGTCTDALVRFHKSDCDLSVNSTGLSPIAPPTCSPFNALYISDALGIACGVQKAIVTSPDGQTDTDGCAGYILTFTCTALTSEVDTLYAYPTACTCSPFSLSFDPITLTACCSGTVSITVDDQCTCCTFTENMCLYFSSSGPLNKTTISLTYQPTSKTWTGTKTVACGEGGPSVTLDATVSCDNPPNCNGYRLTLECNGTEEFCDFPASCTCDPFLFTYGPFAVACCSDEVTVKMDSCDRVPTLCPDGAPFTLMGHLQLGPTIDGGDGGVTDGCPAVDIFFPLIYQGNTGSPWGDGYDWWSGDDPSGWGASVTFHLTSSDGYDNQQVNLHCGGLVSGSGTFDYAGVSCDPVFFQSDVRATLFFGTTSCNGCTSTGSYLTVKYKFTVTEFPP